MKRYLILILIILATVTGWAQDKVNIDVEADNRIVAGEMFNVRFVVNTGKARDISFAGISGMQLLYGPAESSSTSISIINGKTTRKSTKVYTYTLMAEKEGSYTIPSATITVGSATYKTKEKRIRVFSQSEAYGTPGGGNPSDDSATGGNTLSTGGGRDYFVTVTTSKRSVYEQEGFLVTFKLYAHKSEFSFLDAKFPEFDSFVKRDVELDRSRQLDIESYNGTVYYTIVLSQAVLFPQKSGSLTIPAGSFDLLISERQEALSDPFGSFTGRYIQKQRTINSAPFTIQVKPLPTPKPEGFSGVVGVVDLTSDTSSTTNIKTGESFTTTLKLRGSGNLKLAQLPDIQFPEGFESYEPKEEEDISLSSGGEEGLKSKTFFAVPRHVGDYVIPEVRFVYFDTDHSAYRTITLPEQRVSVTKGTGTTSSEVSDYNGKEKVKQLNQDIRYLKKIGSGKTITDINYVTYALSYAAILILAVVLLLLVRYRRAESIETVESRAKHAGTMARRYLKLAAKKRNSGDDLAYYEALLKGLNSYLSAKFHIPTSELSRENIRTRMEELGLSAEVIDRTLDTRTDLEMARYTPDGGLTHRDRLYDQATAVIDSIQSAKVKTKV